MFKAFFRLTADGQVEKWSWMDEDGLSEIPGIEGLDGFTVNMDDAHYEEAMKKSIKIIEGGEELHGIIQQEMKPIKLGIAPNGFDTNMVDEGFIYQMTLRGTHRGCWSLYATPGGRVYRAHCSSFEMKAMEKEYDAEQRSMEWLKKEGFQMVDVNDDSDILLQNLVGYWGPVGSCKDLNIGCQDGSVMTFSGGN